MSYDRFFLKQPFTPTRGDVEKLLIKLNEVLIPMERISVIRPEDHNKHACAFLKGKIDSIRKSINEQEPENDIESSPTFKM